MAVRADSVIVELEARVAEYERKIAGADRKFDKHMDSMRRQAGLTERRNVQAFNNISSSANNMGRTLAGAASALALAAGAAAGIRVLASFEQAMSTVAAITQATGDKLADLEATARELGSTTRFSATQAAEGMLFLARAGFTTDEVLASIEGTLQLAQAGNLDLGRAADIASNALSGFNLGAEESARLVDVLAAAANSANTDVNQLGEALKFAAPTAVALGLDVEETVAIIGKLSDAGIQAGLAGRGFQSLGTQFENNRDKIEKLIGSYDLAEEGLAAIIRRLDKAGITTKQIIEIFRAENLDVFTVLRNASLDGAKGLDALQGKLEDSAGTAKRVATVMDDNLNGALLATKSRLEELILALGEAGATDALINALEVMQDLLTGLAENADIVVAAIVGLTTTALLPMAAAMGGKVIAAVKTLQAELVVLNAIAGTSTTALKTFTAVAGRLLITLGPLGIALAASAAAYGLMASNGKDAAAAISAAGDALRKYDSVNAQITEDIRTLTGLQNDLTDAIENQKPIIEATKRADIAALNDRIAKNRELAAVLEAQARAELANAQRNSGRFTSREAQDLLGDRAFGERQQAGTTPAGSPMYVRPLKPQEELNALLKEEYDQIVAIQDAGGTLTKQQRELLDTYADRLESVQQIANLEERVAALQSASSGGGANESAAIIPTDPEDFAGGGDEPDTAAKKRVEAAKDALKELEDAFNTTYQIERDEAEAAWKERIDAIKALGLTGEEARKKELQAEIAYRDEIKRIDDEEAQAAKDKIQREEDILQQVLDARDRAANRSIEIAMREFDRRKEMLENSFSDTVEGERRKNEALKALKEEREKFLSDARDATTGFSTKSPMDQRIADIEEARDRELALELEKFETLADYQEEYEQRRIEIIEAAEEQVTAIRMAALGAQLGAASDTFDSLADIAKAHAGKQAGVYKTLFTLAKGFKLAETLVNAPAAAGEAIANSPLPYPLNLAAGAATYAAVMAQAANLRSVDPGFAQGVIDLQGPGTSRSDSIPARLSRGESVITARGTALNPNLLDRINRGVDVEGQLARITQPVNVNPAYFSSGGRPINVAGSSITFTGPINQDTMPEVRALLDEYDRKQDRRIERALYRDRHWSTPRHEKGKFMR